MINRALKRGFAAVGILLGISGASAFGYALVQQSAFDASIEKVYDIPVPRVTRSTDPAVLARGKHLTETLAGCSLGECHGADFGGGKSIELGPLGTLTAPNITGSGIGAAYSDGEIARLVEHGIKKDGRSVRFMPVPDFNWLPESDVVAIVSYLRSVPPVEKANGPLEVRLLGKILDRRDQFDMDVARRIDHQRTEAVPAPAPTAEYGAFVARLCMGCHGKGLGGGPIPGAPSSIPIPLNLTPHATGLARWTYGDFEKLTATGVRKNGKTLNPFMPIQALAKMDDVEKRALWAYLQSLPPKELGTR